MEEAVICHMCVNQKEKKRYSVRGKKLDHEKAKIKINEISCLPASFKTSRLSRSSEPGEG